MYKTRNDHFPSSCKFIFIIFKQHTILTTNLNKSMSTLNSHINATKISRAYPLSPLISQKIININNAFEKQAKGIKFDLSNKLLSDLFIVLNRSLPPNTNSFCQTIPD